METFIVLLHTICSKIEGGWKKIVDILSRGPLYGLHSLRYDSCFIDTMLFIEKQSK